MIFLKINVKVFDLALFVPVAFGVVTINETIDKGDSADLLLALKHKNVALRSVTPECAQQYRDELKSAKDKKEDPSTLFQYLFFANLVVLLIIFYP